MKNLLFETIKSSCVCGSEIFYKNEKVDKYKERDINKEGDVTLLGVVVKKIDLCREGKCEGGTDVIDRVIKMCLIYLYSIEMISF